MKKLEREGSERFYAEIMNYLRGEPSDIRPGTILITKATIAISRDAE
jgi:hypothetical protein